MPLVLGFAGLLGMFVLLTSALTDASLGDILAGRGDDLYRERKGDHAKRMTGASQAIDAGVAAVATPAPATGAKSTVPDREWNPYRKPIATWIVPILDWAHAHGWSGVVTSGERTPAEQLKAAGDYGLQHYPDGPLASNHVKGNSGAVDVTQPEQLANVLKGWRGVRKLVWGGPVIDDRVHFSANGH